MSYRVSLLSVSILSIPLSVPLAPLYKYKNNHLKVDVRLLSYVYLLFKARQKRRYSRRSAYRLLLDCRRKFRYTETRPTYSIAVTFDCGARST